ncbi:hypothetical protein CEXT_334471 [Caerostris extrusa]|uniref:Uncharacterized protein n=1 Tax=Caerostris extrusa TaxID=172846 RepID=A0AAV4WVC2_CAEEX|nr:hypothetical protein CEXT_334471 [Caerostris extrusa]
MNPEIKWPTCSKFTSYLVKHLAPVMVIILRPRVHLELDHDLSCLKSQCANPREEYLESLLRALSPKHVFQNWTMTLK